jgi:hypothetical protein
MAAAVKRRAWRSQPRSWRPIALPPDDPAVLYSLQGETLVGFSRGWRTPSWKRDALATPRKLASSILQLLRKQVSMRQEGVEWNWSAFWRGFFAGMGRSHLVFMLVITCASVFGDTSSASVFSVLSALYIWNFIGLIYCYGAGEDAVREWRERHANEVQ